MCERPRRRSVGCPCRDDQLTEPRPPVEQVLAAPCVRPRSAGRGSRRRPGLVCPRHQGRPMGRGPARRRRTRPAAAESHTSPAPERRRSPAGDTGRARSSGRNCGRRRLSGSGRGLSRTARDGRRPAPLTVLGRPGCSETEPWPRWRRLWKLAIVGEVGKRSFKRLHREWMH